MEPVRSRRNPRVVSAGRLRRARQRRKTGHTLIEGPHLLAEAIDAGVEILDCFVLEDDRSTRARAERSGFDVTIVEPEVLAVVADTTNPRGPVAVIAVPTATSDGGRDLLVADIADPGNAGTLIRTAAAFGLDAVVPDGAVDPWSPKALRGAAGAHFRTGVLRSIPVGVGTIATVVRRGTDVRSMGPRLDPGRRWAVLVGSEAHGLDDEAVAGADVRVTIAMPGGTESLNAAVAGAIVAHELAGWRASLRSARPTAPDERLANLAARTGRPEDG